MEETPGILQRNKYKKPGETFLLRFSITSRVEVGLEHSCYLLWGKLHSGIGGGCNLLKQVGKRGFTFKEIPVKL